MAHLYPQLRDALVYPYPGLSGPSISVPNNLKYEEGTALYGGGINAGSHSQFPHQWDGQFSNQANGMESDYGLSPPSQMLDSTLNPFSYSRTVAAAGPSPTDFGPPMATATMVRSLSQPAPVINHFPTFTHEDRPYSPVSPPPLHIPSQLSPRPSLHDNKFFASAAGSRSYPGTRENSPDDSSDDEEYSQRHRKSMDIRNAIAYREKRREAHTAAEQKRRDGIKKGYQRLQTALPQSQTQELLGNQKASKAFVLQKSIEYVTYLISSKQKQEEEVKSLQNELTGLQIMKQNYEKMAQNMRHQKDCEDGSQAASKIVPVPDSVKFHVFQHIMEDLFQSFDSNVNAESFADLSGSAFNWLEEYCKPPQLRHAVDMVLKDFQRNSQHSKTRQAPGP